jgi:GT2 family glycosyltransferase
VEKIAIIIVNYKGWNDLEHCLDSLVLIDSKTIHLEVIVVDNCSNDGKFEQFKTKYADFNFVLNTSNNGFANGCNVGAALASSNYYLFLNPDTKVEQKNLENYFQTYREHSEIALLSCLQIDEKGNYYNPYRLFPTLITFFGIPRAIYKVLKKNTIEKRINYSETFFYPDWVTGAVILISKEWFEKVKGWNEDYWMYMEDVDLCKRIFNQNGKIAILKSATIFHKHGGASRINLTTKALTKTEVLISKHVYISNNFSTFTAFLLHIRLIFGTLFEKLLLTILSIPLFFVKKLKVNQFIFINYINYLFSAMLHKTFISPRAVNFSKISKQ